MKKVEKILLAVVVLVLILSNACDKEIAWFCHSLSKAITACITFILLITSKRRTDISYRR